MRYVYSENAGRQKPNIGGKTDIEIRRVNGERIYFLKVYLDHVMKTEGIILTIQQKLFNFAKEVAHPYVLQLPFYIEHENEISVLLVGSVATGTCTDTSDVDICFLCRDNIFCEISKNTDWAKGRPTEIILDNIQLHYYAINFETLEKKIAEYDDVAFYVYGNAIALNDNAGLFDKIKNNIFNDEIKNGRKHKALDMLIRRNRALTQILEIEPDPILRITVGLELIEHLLKVTALSDNAMFDKRKRFYTTALTGNNGMTIKPKIDVLLACLSEISLIDNKDKSSAFLQIVNECIGLIITKFFQNLDYFRPFADV
jgi:predicted nucleotidyltransferase